MNGPIRILFDARLFGTVMTDIRARTGIFRVAEETLDRLVQDKDLSILLYDSSGSYFCCQAFIHENKKRGYILFRSARFWKLRFFVWKFFKMILRSISGSGFFRSFFAVLKKYCENLEWKRYGWKLSAFQVYHSPSGLIPEAFRNCKNIAKVIEVHDLIPLLFPHFLDSRAIHGKKHPIQETIEALSVDDFVICNSASTRNDLLAYSKNLAPDRVFVAPLAASSKFFPVTDPARIADMRKRYRIASDQKYILSVCTLEPRKNLETVIRGFGMFVRQNKIEDVALVLVGTAGWKYKPLLRQIDAAGDLTKKIILTGFVPDEDLAILYSGALVFSYMSFYEGFGLPPLEAMQCGTPVITSNTSSLPEVVGDAGIMLAPRDEKGVAQYFSRFYLEPEYREAFSKKALAQAKRFSWDAHCDVVEHVYRSISACA
jgi:glycosyltransferase involved in cell wall biosynthesis